ncbi:MAG TPA: hypothetical protein VMR90_04920 [Candidatus Cybelea sp.]|nr:hypothetical protein [Candidatus Cybelea sp.]
MPGLALAQQKRLPAVIERTFVPDEPLPCVAFNRMAARLDVVYKTEQISKAEYDEGMKKYKDASPEEGVDYFMSAKNEYQRVSLQHDKLAEFIRWYVIEGGRGQMNSADTQCSTELEERQEKYSGIYTLRRLQDAMTLAQAEGLLADVALAGQDAVIKALLESEAARRKDIDRYNKLVESVNTYNKAVNDLVVTVNTAMNEPKGSKLAPTLNFNFVRLQPITCTQSTFAFSNSQAYLTNVRAAASSIPTMQCE